MADQGDGQAMVGCVMAVLTFVTGVVVGIAGTLIVGGL